MVTFSSGCADFRGRGASFSALADAAPEWEQELRTISASRLVCSGSKPAEIQTDRNVASVLCLNEKETSGYKTHTHKKKIRRKKERREEVWLQTQQQSSPTQVGGDGCSCGHGPGALAAGAEPGRCTGPPGPHRRPAGSLLDGITAWGQPHRTPGDRRRHRRPRRVRPREGSQRKGQHRSKGQHSSSFPDP